MNGKIRYNAWTYLPWGDESDLWRDDIPGVFLCGWNLGDFSVDTMSVVAFACYNI
jgi:hypothetical protein